jgi:hypothetical protein
MQFTAEQAFELADRLDAIADYPDATAFLRSWARWLREDAAGAEGTLDELLAAIYEQRLRAAGNIGDAARSLGLDRTTFYRQLKKLRAGGRLNNRGKPKRKGSKMADYPVDFIEGIKHIINDIEGGATLVRDSGGLTKFGISAKAYPDLDIAALTFDQAVAIYWKDFFLAAHLDELPVAVRMSVLNAEINVGRKTGVIMLQRALRAVGLVAVDDGVLGELSIDAIKTACELGRSFAVVAAFRSECAGHYRLIAQARPDEAKYLKGWLNRAYSL